MNEFEKEQKVITIGNVSIGGQPGENPNVCIGSVFYKGHAAVLDEKLGKFDKNIVENEINEFIDVCEKSSIPYIIDVVGSYVDSLYKKCVFIADLVDCPFLVDGTNDTSRIPVLTMLSENGLLNRAILNSIDENTTEEYIKKLKEIKTQSAVLLAFGSRYITPEKKLKLIRERLLPMAESAGIKNIIIDTAVLDLPSLSFTAETSFLVKKEFGLPSGCAPANAVYGWQEIKKFGNEARISAITSASVYCVAKGSDFVLFGPIKFGKYIVPSIAMVSGMDAYYRKRLLRKNISEKTPMTKIF